MPYPMDVGNKQQQSATRPTARNRATNPARFQGIPPAVDRMVRELVADRAAGSRGSYLPPTARAQIVALRTAGSTIREIAEKTGRSTNTVLGVLRLPESRQQLADNADAILKRCRQAALDLSLEALEAASELIAKRDRFVVCKVLAGTKVLTERTEQAVEVSSEPPRTKEELAHFVAFGHWPGETCADECKAALAGGAGGKLKKEDPKGATQ